MIQRFIKNVMIILMAFLIVLSGLFGNIGNIPVYADDEKEEESEGDDEEEKESEEDGDEDTDFEPSKVISGKGNMYGLGTKKSEKAVTSLLEQAAEYDIRVQFLTTYSFLIDDYGVENGSSTYHDIYTNNDNQSKIFENLETSPDEILSDISGKELMDPHSNHGEDESNQNTEDFDEVKEEFAEELAKKHFEKVAKTLGTSDENKKKIYDNRDDSKAGKSYYVGYKFSHFNPKGNYMTNGDTSDKAKKFFNKKYTEIFMDFLSSANIKEDMSEEDFVKEVSQALTVTSSPQTLKSAVSDYRSFNDDDMYAKDGFDGIGPKGKHDKAHQTEYIKNYPGGDWDKYVSSDMVISIDRKEKGYFSKEEAYEYMDIMPNYISMAAYKKGVDNGINEDKEWGNVANPQDSVKKISKEIGKEIENYYKKQLKEELEEDEDLQDLFTKYKKSHKEEKERFEGLLGDNDRIVTWMKLTPEYEDLDKDDVHELKTHLEDEENAHLDGNRIYVKDGSKDIPRPIQLRDLHYSTKAGKILVANGKSTARAVVGTRDTKLNGVTISRYAGMKMTDNMVFKNSLEREGEDESSYNIGINKYIAAYNGKKHNGFNINISAQSDDIIGIDSYGNIIDSTTGTIIIPYWQNETVKRFELDSNNVWISNSIFKNKNRSELDSIVKDNVSKIKENKISEDDIKEAFKEEGYDIELPGNLLELSADTKNLEQSLTDGEGKPDKDKVIMLALAITAGTYQDVKDWNKDFLEEGQKSSELYIKPDSGRDTSDGGGGDSDNKFEEYTDADLRERIMMILDYGFYEVLRLTVASLIVNIYNTGFIHYTMSSVFHTTTVADTDVYEDLLVIFSTLLASVVGAYVLWMGLQVFRQQMRMMEVVKQFIVITIIVLIPTMFYAPFVDLVINKPTPFFLGKNMEQTMILDNHLHRLEKQEKEDGDDTYRYLFNGDEELRDKTQDYIVKFYTTTHKKGYDIEDIEYDDLNWTDRIKLSNAEQTGGWDKRDVESVRVSIYDLFDWVTARVDKEEDDNEYTDLDLFDWLEEKHGDRYEGVSEYKEIKYDPNFRNKQLGKLKKEDIDADEIKASDLFKDLYEASASKSSGGSELSDRIQNMYKISEVVKTTDKHGAVLDKEEVEAIIRDFSLTSQGRELAFGTSPEKNSLIKKPDKDTPNISNKTVEAWERISDKKLLIPRNDYMNLESIIDEINPDNGDPRNTPNDKVIYNVNREILSDYINVQSMVRESVGAKVGESEFMAITLNEFFVLNDELEIPMFPTKIEPDSISLDSFARMIYIPLQEYQQDDDTGLDNLAEYLSLRDNPFMLLILFVPALLALVLWGMFYLVIFGFLLLVVSVVTFFWQYIIRRDMQNKSWLGSLWIVLRLALAKLGLLALWFGMAYIMNYMYNRFGGFTYAYTYVHSLIIIAYVFFCTKHVFLKTLRQVRENPSELGGSAMMNGFKDMLGRFKNGKVFGRNKPSGDTKGADEKKSVEKALDNEGSEGAISAGNLSKIATNFRNIKDRFMGDGHAEVDDILNEIDPLGNRMSRRFPKITKGVKGSSRREMLGDYDAIGSTEGISKTSSGMLESMAAAGEVGQVMSSSADGSQIAKLAVGSVENASRMVSHLNKQGLKAWNDDEGNVYYNSQGVDLESAEVRKGLYGGLLEEYYNEIDEDTSLQEQTEENVNPYTQLDNGNLKIDVGDKGISTSNVDAILGSTEFRDSFVLESSPVKGMNGEYIQGSLVVKPRNGVDEQSAINQMFSTDTRLREERGEQERGEIEQNKSISFEGLQDFENVNKYIKNGMSLQGNKIIYDSNNSKHVKSVSKLKNKINRENESKYGEKLEFMTNLASHTAYGDDSGINVEYSNTSQDKEVQNFARKTGLVGDKVESKVYAGDSAKRISNNIKEARNLLSMDNETINDYHQKRDELFRFGDTAFIGEDENYDKGFNKLVKSAKKVGGDKEQLQERMDEYTELGNKFQNASITEQEYNRGVEALYSDLQTDLQDNGTFAKVLSKEVRREKAPKELKTSFDAYVKSKRNLEDSGVSSDMVERFNSSEFTDLMDTLDNIEDIEDNGDGTLNIKSDEALNTDDTQRIIEKMKGIDSKEE